MTVCKVVEVDVDIDFDDAITYKWIVGKVDMPAYQTILDQEADAVAVIKSAEKTKKRAELRAAIVADASELQALPIAHMPDAPAAAE